MIDRMARAKYRQDVVREFLRLQGVAAPLSSLAIDDILRLRISYGREVGRLVSTLVDDASLVGAEKTRLGAAVKSLVNAYTAELEEAARRERSRGGMRRLGRTALNLLALKVAPVGLWSLGSEAIDAARSRRHPLHWFLVELRNMQKNDGR